MLNLEKYAHYVESWEVLRIRDILVPTDPDLRQQKTFF